MAEHIECHICKTPDVGPFPPLGWTQYRLHSLYRASTVELQTPPPQKIYFCAPCHANVIVRMTFDSKLPPKSTDCTCGRIPHTRGCAAEPECVTSHTPADESFSVPEDPPKEDA